MSGGDWAGQDAIFQGAGCPGTCVGKSLYTSTGGRRVDAYRIVDYVNKNPASFKNAYWDIASLKVYSRAL
jgi:hypothetical protein